LFDGYTGLAAKLKHSTKPEMPAKTIIGQRLLFGRASETTEAIMETTI
jgi:hypothetical protein